MAKPAVEQQFALLAALGANVDWNLVTIEEVQLGITEAQRVGPEFVRFIRNGFRLQCGIYLRDTGEFSVQIPALPRPTLAELRVDFPWIREKDGIERDCSPTTAVTMKLKTVLGADETSPINGAEYERRLASHLSDLHGYQQLKWLVQHQDEHPAFKALLGKIYLDGPALVVVDEGGRRGFPYLSQSGVRFGLDWRSVGFGFHSYGRVASSSK